MTEAASGHVEAMVPAQVERLTILRPDNLGDVVLFSGAFEALRARFPNAEVTVCAKRYAGEWLRNCPHVDRVIPWEAFGDTIVSRLPRVRGQERLRRAWRALRSRVGTATELLLLPVRSPTRVMHDVGLTMPARWRAAVAGDFSNQSPAEWAEVESRYDQLLQLHASRARDPELTVTRDFLRMLGCRVSTADILPRAWLGAADRQWAARALPHADGVVQLAIAPGGGTLEGKAYPPAGFAAALGRLDGRVVHAVVVGSREERSACERVAAAVAEVPGVRHVRMLAGATSILQLAAVLERCDAVVSTDTATLHIATALDRPTVGILGGGHFGRFYPWGDPARHRVASHPLPCYWCNWRCVHETMRCVQDIPPSAIADALAPLVDDIGGTSSVAPREPRGREGAAR